MNTEFTSIEIAATGLYGRVVVMEENKLLFEDTKINLTDSEIEAATKHLSTINKLIKEENSLNNRIAEAKAYLASTDFKVLPDYDKDATDVIAKRVEAREFIRANEYIN